MDDKDRLTIATSLKKLTTLVEANVATTGREHEAEERSKNNELIAVELLTFGEYVADVAHMAQTEKDHVEQMFEHMKLELINNSIYPTDGGKATGSMSVARAESEVKTDLSYIEALDQLRSLQKSAEVLKRKERSLNAILDQSRSRLSLVSKSLPT